MSPVWLRVTPPPEPSASQGMDTLSHGALLNADEEAGFELLLTTDRRIRHQQNLGAADRVRMSSPEDTRA